MYPVNSRSFSRFVLIKLVIVFPVEIKSVVVPVVIDVGENDFTLRI